MDTDARASELSRVLDGIAERAGAALARNRWRRGWRSGESLGLKAAFAVGTLALIWAVASHLPGVSAPPLLLFVAVVVLGTPLVALAVGLRERARPSSRRERLGIADEVFGLKDRLVAADEFAGLADRGSFHAAAMRDADRVVAPVAAAPIDLPVQDGALVARAWWTAGAAASLLALAALVANTAPDANTNTSGSTDSVRVADLSGGGDPDLPEPAEVPVPPSQAESEELLPPDARSGRSPGSRSQPTRLDTPEKPSSGRASEGRGGNTSGSSGASQARGAPTGQTPETDASEPKPSKPQARPEQEPGTEPERNPDQDNEDSGSTAGKGSSKGSNRNPVTSSWKSRDQVSTDDEAELEDDMDTDDEDESQENRGGVQPSLRDRRPPTSRDLQIGFGNRPNPDANGRGGPSQPKKSRGVASLVLGVPIPDRVKGRAGPGRTKVTQERVEPESEEALPSPALEQTPRQGPSGGPPPIALDALTRAVVRAYFLPAPGAPSAPSTP